MDCAKLHQDITKLTELRDKLEGQLAQMNETGKGKGEAKAVMAEAEQFEEEALGRYLDDFVEKNPELNGWEFGELIEGFEDEYGNERGVRAIAQLSNGNMLVGGGYGVLYEYGPDENGKWGLGERVVGFTSKYGSEADVDIIAQLPNGSMLVGGWYGALYEYRPDENGKWGLGERITGFEDKNEDETHVSAVAQMPNGNMLVGSDEGMLRELKRPPLTVETLRQKLDELAG